MDKKVKHEHLAQVRSSAGPHDSVAFVLTFQLRFYLALTLAAPVIWPCRAILRLFCRLFGIYDAWVKDA